MSNNLFTKISRRYYLKKYKGIWGFKEYLAQNDIQNPKLIEMYDEYFKRYGAWIGVKAQFAGIPCFPHEFYGVFISGGTIIGKNVVIFQHVTIGSNTISDSKNPGCPTIGNNVYIGAGAKIIGNITIGDNCRIGANAIVYEDMSPHSVALQASTRIIQKTNLDNRFFGGKNGKLVYYDDGDWIEVKNTE